MRLLIIAAIALAACLPSPARPASATPAVAPATTTPEPFVCPVTFCYPRLGIAGGIEPYSDASGQEDIGIGIRSLPGYPLFLVGHAYTQFGRIRDFRIGDRVIAYGTSYTVYEAIAGRCGITTVEQLIAAGHIGPLYMQTSLTKTCDAVLVVMAR